MKEFRGQCHCGGISYTLQWPESEGFLPARRCACTYCRRIDGAWTSHPGASLQIEAPDESVISRYRFGTRTADFLFCNRCGITLFALCELEGCLRAVVNVHTIRSVAGGEAVTPDLFDWRGISFDGESIEQRLQRRSQYWIGRVEFR